jgi:hypothetical protein
MIKALLILCCILLVIAAWGISYGIGFKKGAHKYPEYYEVIHQRKNQEGNWIIYSLEWHETNPICPSYKGIKAGKEE